MTNECTQPHLGLATNKELLDELQARIKIHCAGGLDYRTIDSEKYKQIPYVMINAMSKNELVDLWKKIRDKILLS